jgi:hypothetical protein
MKEPVKPIKRHEALTQFSREHHFGLLLVWKIRQGLKMNLDPVRIGDYIIYFFDEELSEHFRSEEIDLFVKLSESDPLRQQAFQEHEVICDLVDKIRNDKSSKHFLQKFADELESHIRFEERILFNHIQDKVSTEELISLLVRHGKRECDIDNNWKDQFWIK